MRRTLTASLTALDLLLAGLLAWLWIDPSGALRNVRWQAPAAVRPEFGSLSAAAIARDDAATTRFLAILDRPVFSPTRRPPVPPKVVVPPPPPPPDPLATIHIYGLVSGASGGGVLLRVDGKTRRMTVAEKIGDWSLKEIRSGELVFSRGSETRVVRLVQAGQATLGAALPPAVSAPSGLIPAAPAPSAGAARSAPQAPSSGGTVPAPAASPPQAIAPAPPPRPSPFAPPRPPSGGFSTGGGAR